MDKGKEAKNQLNSTTLIVGRELNSLKNYSKTIYNVEVLGFILPFGGVIEAGGASNG